MIQCNLAGDLLWIRRPSNLNFYQRVIYVVPSDVNIVGIQGVEHVVKRLMNEHRASDVKNLSGLMCARHVWGGFLCAKIAFPGAYIHVYKYIMSTHMKTLTRRRKEEENSKIWLRERVIHSTSNLSSEVGAKNKSLTLSYIFSVQHYRR